MGEGQEDGGRGAAWIGLWGVDEVVERREGGRAVGARRVEAAGLRCDPEVADAARDGGGMRRGARAWGRAGVLNLRPCLQARRVFAAGPRRVHCVHRPQASQAVQRHKQSVTSRVEQRARRECRRHRCLLPRLGPPPRALGSRAQRGLLARGHSASARPPCAAPPRPPLWRHSVTCHTSRQSLQPSSRHPSITLSPSVPVLPGRAMHHAPRTPHASLSCSRLALPTARSYLPAASPQQPNASPTLCAHPPAKLALAPRHLPAAASDTVLIMGRAHCPLTDKLTTIY